MQTYLPMSLIDQHIILPEMGSWPQSVHLFDADSVYAINAALAAQRPLLLRGEPGTGKSQLARAAAHCLQRVFVSEVLHARSECQDLQWYFDAVGRLGEAQTLGGLTPEQAKVYLDPIKYLSPGALWWTFGWKNALIQYERCDHQATKPLPPEGWAPEKGSVLLIDEIDKADADLPNGLLETLGNGAFSVPYLKKPIGLCKQIQPPLVIITTNEERELPGAFVRRCMVLHLALPKDNDTLRHWLMRRGRYHFEACSDAVRKAAAEQLLEDREEALKQGVTPPGQAEYLDILRAVVNITEAVEAAQKERAQLDMLAHISRFALKKYLGLSAL